MGNKGSTPLHKAAAENDISKLRWAVQQHPGLVNKQEEEFGWAPLHVASFKGADAIVRELLARGADVRLLDKDGRTALHLCALQGSPEVARALLRAGVDREVRDKRGAAAYDYAIQKHTDVAALIGIPSTPSPANAAAPSASGAGSAGGAGAAHAGQPISAGGMPPVQHAAATTNAPHTLLPPPPPAPAGQLAAAVGYGTYPRVPYERAPADALLQPAPQPQGQVPPAYLQVQAYPQVPGALPPAGPVPPHQQPPAPAPAAGGGYAWPGTAAPPPQAATAAGARPVAARDADDDWGSGGDEWGGRGGGGGPAAGVAPAPQPGRAPQPTSAGGSGPHTPPPPPHVQRASGAGARPAAPGAGAGAGGRPGPSKVDDDDDDGWGPSARTDWGGEPDIPAVAPGPSPQPRNLNPLQSARFQLQQLLGLKLNLGGSTGGSGKGSKNGDASDSDTSPSAPSMPPPQPGAATPAAQAPGSFLSAASSSYSPLVSSSSSGRVYSADQLSLATAGFSPLNLLGQGGFGRVYRGALDGIPVAVKVLSSGGGAGGGEAGGSQGMREWQAEATLLARLHHPHILLLIGSCPDKAMLVYEYMSGGSLDQYLFTQQQMQALGAGGVPAPAAPTSLSPLTWQERVRVAAETASALLFLHSAPEPIVHMDVKPANILLDSSSRISKLADVGLARLIRPKDAGGAAGARGGGSVGMQDSRLVGSPMYMDPVYMRTAQVHPSQDVYGLGMVMLQLLTGHPDGNVVSVVEEARQQPLSFANIIDPRAGAWPAAEAVAFADLALKCVEYKRQDRPDLRTVLLPALTQLRQRTLLYAAMPTAPPASYAASASSGGASMPGLPPASPAAVLLAGPSQEPAPAMFLCPITQDVMDDPVVAADGYTYERLAIAEWVQRSATSPLTNMALAHTQLTPNLTLRSAIKEWRDTQGKKK